MKVIKTAEEMRAYSRQQRKEGNRIGFVPTLGSLHPGHASLIEKSVSDCGCTVVSIFLNPLQFDSETDLEHYPVTFEEDLSLCKKLGVDAVFAPDEQEMYHGGSAIMISVALLGDKLCGLSRPGHFRGVLLVVAKLFNIVDPDTAYFGEKDIQQLTIIRQLIRDLSFGIELVPMPLIREEDGLALSSRNKHLSAEERKSALKLSKTLALVSERVRGFEEDPEEDELTVNELLAEFAEDLVTDPLIELDYFDAVDLVTLDDVTSVRKGMIFAIAAYVGETRLIDNWIYR